MKDLPLFDISYPVRCKCYGFATAVEFSAAFLPFGRPAFVLLLLALKLPPKNAGSYHALSRRREIARA
jgi:hypothetical protein